jgi:hypothetical protein
MFIFSSIFGNFDFRELKVSNIYTCGTGVLLEEVS